MSRSRDFPASAGMHGPPLRRALLFPDGENPIRVAARRGIGHRVTFGAGWGRPSPCKIPRTNRQSRRKFRTKFPAAEMRHQPNRRGKQISPAPQRRRSGNSAPADPAASRRIGFYGNRREIPGEKFRSRRNRPRPAPARGFRRGSISAPPGSGPLFSRRVARSAGRPVPMCAPGPPGAARAGRAADRCPSCPRRTRSSSRAARSIATFPVCAPARPGPVRPARPPDRVGARSGQGAPRSDRGAARRCRNGSPRSPFAPRPEFPGP